FQRVDAALRTRVDGWGRARKDACEATHVRHEQSEALLDLRMRCLARARAEIGALVTLLGQADAAALEHAGRAADDAGEFAARAALPGGGPPPDAAAALEPELPRLAALRGLSKWKEGLAAARELVERARTVGYAPLVASAALQRARFELDAGDDEAAIAAIYEAGRAGSEASDDGLVAEAATDLVFALTLRKPRYEAAGVAYALAEAATARAGNTPARLAQLFRYRARLLDRAGDHVSPLLLSQLD